MLTAETVDRVLRMRGDGLPVSGCHHRGEHGQAGAHGFRSAPDRPVDGTGAEVAVALCP